MKEKSKTSAIFLVPVFANIKPIIITTNKPYTKKEIKKLKDAKLLIESLSNDLYRITNFINRWSYKAAERF